MPIRSQAQNRWAHAAASRGDEGAQQFLDHSLKDMRKGKKGYAKEHPVKAANLPERVQKRYAGGGTIGRRQEVAKGFLRQSVAPKLARRAGRKALIDGAVTKGVLEDVVMAARGASGPASKPASGLVNTLRAVRTKPAAAAAAGAVGGYGTAKTVGKRRFDPEDERRHRQGLEAGALGTGGALAAGYGVRGVMHDSKSLKRRGFDPGQPPQMDSGPWREGSKFRAATTQENRGRVMAHAKELELYSARLRASRGVKGGGALVRGRSGALLGGGLAAMVGASALHGQRRESRWD